MRCRDAILPCKTRHCNEICEINIALRVLRSIVSNAPIQSAPKIHSTRPNIKSDNEILHNYLAPILLKTEKPNEKSPCKTADMKQVLVLNPLVSCRTNPLRSSNHRFDFCQPFHANSITNLPARLPYPLTGMAQ